MEDKDLFVSFDYRDYKNGKANSLNCQIDSLNMMKHYENISQIIERKQKLRLKLYKILVTVSKSIEKIEKKFPEPEIPKDVKIKKRKVKKVSFDSEKSVVENKRHRTIEEELMEIRGKLADLNK